MGLRIDTDIARQTAASFHTLSDAFGKVDLTHPVGFDASQGAVLDAHWQITTAVRRLATRTRNVGDATRDAARGFEEADAAAKANFGRIDGDLSWLNGHR